MLKKLFKIGYFFFILICLKSSLIEIASSCVCSQIYTEYVKLSDELASEKEENSRMKLYMEQILQVDNFPYF